MKEYYATLQEQLNDAVIEFGVDAALKYFATPKELYHLWDEEREREKKWRRKTQKCLNCGWRNGSLCWKTRQMTSDNDWCSAWKRILKPTNNVDESATLKRCC